MGRKYVPFCVSEYQSGDVTCDGNPKAKTDYAKKPCSWRNRCSAFREHLKNSKDEFEKYIELVPDDKVMDGEGSYHGRPRRGRAAFVVWCNALVEKYGVENGVITKKVVAKKKKAPMKKARKASTRRVREKARARKKQLDKLFEHFKVHFIESLEVYRFTPPRGVVRPGRLYVIDRRKTSKYVSVYCKAPGVLGIPVALIRFKPRTMTFDIELPVGIEDFVGIGTDTMKKIHPRPIEDGRFKTTCIGMDKERAAIVAQTIAKMIKRGKIELPPPG